ncbi:diguanylate cyclase DgcJ [Escherichia coli]|uniref:diguanylate cyclase DgcJ n=35 Tax=Enterobacterales TaxID=91347 RepID=UPI003CF5AC49
MISRWKWMLKQTFKKLWFRATLFAIVAIITALLSILFKSMIPESVSVKVGAEAVDNILNILASSMLAVTTFSLSIMVTAYGSATTNVTPRATRLVVEDVTTQNVLATFIGSFLFSLVGIIALNMGAYGERGRVILFIVTLVVIALILITLLRWIQHLTSLGRVGETTAKVEQAAIETFIARARNPCLGGYPWLENNEQPKGTVAVYPEYFAMNNWSFLQSGSIGIDRKDIEKVFTGRTVLSSIYQDQRTKQNVMSLLTPVYVAGQLKGIVLLDINKNNLRNIFYTHDRPLLWRFLNVTLTDTDSGRDIIINQSEDNLFQYVSYVHDLPGGIRVSLSIDILYFITSSWKSVLFWILTALILLNMVRMHFRLYQNVSRENISDAMTGLYNRKILTPELEQRLQKLVQAGSSVMFIAIDMDKLKQINDTLGHQEGDLAITLLAQAIKQSIRKSDYAIRLGGDEFCIILVDSTPQIAAQLPERIEKRLQHIAPQKEIGFSSGIYAMKENDTLHDAYKASDERLYVNKQNKNSRS